MLTFDIVIILRKPNATEFQQIVFFIEEFQLDNRDLLEHQFTAAFIEDNLVGFGRVREHTDCSEICSLGTLVEFRKRGVCKMIVQNLIKINPTNLFLVCIIPDYFKPFGFEIVNEYPDAIQDKKKYCTHELVVPEDYFVLKKTANA